MAQHEITGRLDLLDENGRITEEGWARRPYWRYDRRRIAASRLRIKEWDYYYVLSPEDGYCLTLTMSDLGYISMFAVAWIDFNRQSFSQADTLGLFPAGKIGLSASPETGHITYADKTMSLTYDISPEKTSIGVHCPNFKGLEGEKGLKAELTLLTDKEADSLNIATSWAENRKAFYYNHKQNCIPAQGFVTIGDVRREFKPESSFAGLDWGRGNWTYKNRWYWGSASGRLDGEVFGFNIGYGFSDRTPASENAIVCQNRIHKLDRVDFIIDTKDYLKPWKFTSSDGRFEMDFRPVVDRYANTNFWVIKSVQHQVFGYFSGMIVLDDGRELRLNDFPGFAEDVLNWW